MAYRPRCEERRFQLCSPFDEGCKFRWRSRGERWFFAFWALDNEGEQNGHDECDDGEANERQRADTSNLSCHIVGGFDRGGGIVAQIDFADPGCAVEEEGKPA